jgi:hypothetical protein
LAERHRAEPRSNGIRPTNHRSAHERARRGEPGGLKVVLKKDPMRVDGGEPFRLKLPGISMRSTDEQPIFDRSRRPESG